MPAAKSRKLSRSAPSQPSTTIWYKDSRATSTRSEEASQEPASKTTLRTSLLFDPASTPTTSQSNALVTKACRWAPNFPRHRTLERSMASISSAMALRQGFGRTSSTNWGGERCGCAPLPWSEVKRLLSRPASPSPGVANPRFRPPRNRRCLGLAQIHAWRGQVHGQRGRDAKI